MKPTSPCSPLLSPRARSRVRPLRRGGEPRLRQEARGQSRSQKVVAEKTAALWDRFGGWCAIADWHPAIKSCKETKEGDDIYRVLTLQDGGIIKEKLLDKAGVSYRYAIVESPLPVKNYEAQFSIVPDDDDEDEVNVVWAATYDAADGKDDKEARNTIDGIFKDGIDEHREDDRQEGRRRGQELGART